MSRRAVVFAKTSPEDFDLCAPRSNKKGNTMSALVARKTRVQLGTDLDIDAMSCVLRKRVASGNTNALALEIVDGAVLGWLQRHEDGMAERVHVNCESWFGKRMELQDARRMVASVVKRNVLTAKCAKYVDTYKLEEGGDCVRMEVRDVVPESYCTPIVEFDGLYISKHHFSCSFTVVALLVGGARQASEAAMSQFVREEEEDIENPLAFLSDDDGSAHSFDTTIHHEYMSSFDV